MPENGDLLISSSVSWSFNYAFS